MSILETPTRKPAVKRFGQIIPYSDHHQIRMSQEATGLIAARYGVSPKTVNCIRSGDTGGRLKADEIEARDERHGSGGVYRFSENQLLIGHARGDGLADQDRQEAKDAAHECPKCGRLPHDRTPVCAHCAVAA